MEEEIKSEGKCIYCGETFSQKEISNHLKKHLKEIEKDIPSESENSFHLCIHDGKMFLHVLVNGNASFKTLDTFLRKIWLDCCGHLSNFHHKTFKIGMSKKFNEVLSPQLKFEHEYDYGSTTYLSVNVLGKYNVTTNNDIMLLSRNEPLKIMCSICKKRPASIICLVHLEDEGKGYYCEDCEDSHTEECEDFNDYAIAPLVNSPRMGVCGYEGGIIDKDRDGAYNIT
ncbi:MAG: hypothetical protein M3R36_17525 [Bacteroidota bacterium]|nr:hypothetical protein [Bacteroidota bacterium]